MGYKPGDPRPSDEDDAPNCVRVANISSEPLSLEDLAKNLSCESDPITAKDILVHNKHLRNAMTEVIASGKDVFVPGFYYVAGNESQIGGKKVSDDAGADWKVTQWANQNLFGPVPNEGSWARIFGSSPRKSIIRIIGNNVRRNQDLNDNRFDWDKLPTKEDM